MSAASYLLNSSTWTNLPNPWSTDKTTKIKVFAFENDSTSIVCICSFSIFKIQILINITWKTWLPAVFHLFISKTNSPLKSTTIGLLTELRVLNTRTAFAVGEVVVRGIVVEASVVDVAVVVVGIVVLISGAVVVSKQIGFWQFEHPSGQSNSHGHAEKCFTDTVWPFVFFQSF